MRLALFSNRLTSIIFLPSAIAGGLFLGAGTGAADTAPVECTAATYGRSIDGSSLWSETSTGIKDAPNETNCMIDQFSINNFLYMVGTGASGHPRFMELAPWYDLLPATGAPTWPGTYSPLVSTQLNKSQNEQEAGDGFELMDVANMMTSYDIRVNQPYFNFIANKGYYKQANLQTAYTDFQADSKTGGVWFPPTSMSDTGVGAIEVKTSWRNYGPATLGACPGDIMHCEIDSDGTSWGLVGFHLVQKTIHHGEFIWSTFEHVGNAPDCVPGGTSPIAKEPADPVNAGQSINLNKNISSLKNSTGWNYFNYSTYTLAGGNNGLCTYPGLLNGTQPICLTSPEGATQQDWVQVNVCRTNPLPAVDACANSMGGDNGDTIACLNQSMLGNFPAGLDGKWKYYQLVGMEWLFNGASVSGAQIVGCFTIDHSDPSACPNYPGGSGEEGLPNYGRDGSKTMANTTMETWMQRGMVLNSKFQGVVTATDCFGCHQPATASFQGQVYQGDMSHIFGRVSQ